MAALGQASGYAPERARVGMRVDFGLIVSSLLLLLMGLATLYSQGYQRPGSQFTKQVTFALLGLGPFALFLIVHPRFWLRAMPIVYGLNLVVLAAVLKMGHKVLGAVRWIQIGPLNFQPSEMAKLMLILTLSAFYAVRQDRIQRPSTFLLSILHLGVPMLLVFLQPHLGATVVMIVIWLCISLAANIPMRTIGFALGALLLLAAGVFSVPALRNKILHGYQKDRIEAIHGQDIKDSNYQTFRAEIAFGVGGVSGAGFLKGEQKQAGYIPEQDNDFIFSVVGEEGGLVGCALVLAAFGFFFFRIWLIMFQATEPYYRMIAAGVLGLMAFHMAVNMAMVLGLIPVVGLWLPFFSAGGTALMLCIACVGLLLNVRAKERPVLFS